MNNPATIFSKDNVTIYANGKTYIVGRQYAEFQDITEALKAGDFERALEMADRATAIKTKSEGAFEVRDGVVYRNGLPIHNVITERILQFVDEGLPFAPLVKFLENLLSNPSQRAVTESYTFLEHKNLPVTEDGHFLAYKAVRSDYFSKTAGKITLLSGREENGRIYNGIGEIIECVRNEVDDDKDRTCSKGLHAGALEYVNSFGNGITDKIVVVKINPRDIVSIPSDENGQKLRACRYEVIADFVGAIEKPLVQSGGGEFTRPASEDEDEDEAPTCPECGDVSDYDGELCDSCQLAEEEAEMEYTCECGGYKDSEASVCDDCIEDEGCDCEICRP